MIRRMPPEMPTRATTASIAAMAASAAGLRRRGGSTSSPRSSTQTVTVLPARVPTATETFLARTVPSGAVHRAGTSTLC